MKKFDIAIIGGGASGLAAAIEATRTDSDIRVAILEKEAKVGQKLLATGNGRCNLSNADISANSYNSEAANLLTYICDFGNDLEFFNSLGVITRNDSEGRFYPYSNAAASVLDALRIAAFGNSTELLSSFEVISLSQSHDCFVIESKAGERIIAKRVIIACGSQAGVKSSSSPFVLELPLIAKNHTLRRFTPALSPIITEAALTSPLKGLRVRAGAALIDGKNVIRKEMGEVSFGSDYLSGICIMNLSQYICNLKNAEIVLDFAPEFSFDSLLEYLFFLREQRKQLLLEDFLTGLLLKRIGQQVLKASGCGSLGQSVSALTEKQLKNIAAEIKSRHFPVCGMAKFSSAQVARGGVTAQSVTSSLESMSVKGLFFCGEALDVNGDCGGFNLHWAWGSGRLAGHSAAKKA